MIEVRQFKGKVLYNKFIVKDKKKIEFWRRMEIQSSQFGILTRVKEL